MSFSSQAPRRRRRTLLAAAVGALFLLGVAQPATADPYGNGSPGAGLLPDNRGEDWCFGGGDWSGFFGDAAYMAAGNLDAQTNLTVTKSFSCDAHTDIILNLWSGIGTRGFSQCTSTLPNSMCDQWQVFIDPDFIRANMVPNPPPASFEKNIVKTLCHEMGHTVGLKHSEPDIGDDCMHSGDVSNGSWSQYTSYSPHHVAHINSGTVSAW